MAGRRPEDGLPDLHSAGPVEAGLFGLALISVLWAYDGFADLSYAAGEVRDPQRNLPRALIFGTLAIVVMISTFGSVNGTLLVNPRIFFAMAEDKLFFQSMARVHPRYQTPYIAIILTASLGVFFVLTRTFEQLADTFVLVMWPFYALSVAALYRLRRTRPDLERPYRAIGYPVLPALFILGAFYLITNAMITEPLWTSVTFGIVLVGIPVYLLMFRR